MDEENSDGLIESSMTSGEFVIPRKMDIEMNGLQLDLSAAPESVQRYHINITKIMKNKEKDATKGAREDLPTQHRRRALFAVFRQLVKSHPEAFGEDRHKHVYDLGNTFYSVGCTITQEHGDVVFRIPAEEIKSEFSRKFLSKGGLKELLITVQCTGEVFIKGPNQNIDDGTRREAARFFDVLTSQILFHGGFRDGDSLHAIENNDFSDHHIFGNKFFEKHCEHDVKLGEGKCVKSGFEKNVRCRVVALKSRRVRDGDPGSSAGKLSFLVFFSNLGCAHSILPPTPQLRDEQFGWCCL
ncbi:hypothetical protein Y032_0341g3013 [Ancylostoma ceylanicum]|nr:hypothetical protein Y032_0341g3013 [Ancylostoma ceylanicum]